MATCATCRWFREARPQSQLLSRALPTSAKEVAEALGAVVQDEQKQRDAEAAYKRSQASAARDTWPTRPVVSDFCGLREAEHTYFIAEVKNAGGRCGDHDTALEDPRPCASCLHRAAPTGPQQDQRREATYVRLAARNISADVKRDTTGSLLEQYRQGVSARMALEIAGAYQGKGHLLAPPSYLASCRHFSAPDDVVLCLFANPHDKCPAWRSASERIGPPMTSSSLPSQPIPPVFGAHGSRASDVTPPGSSTTDHQLLGRVAAMLAWVLDIEIEARVWALVHDDVSSADEEELARLQEWVTMHEQADAEGPESLDLVREVVQPEMVAGLRVADSAAARELVAAYDRANPPIAAGSPPLTQEVVDSYLGILSFVDALLEERSWAPVSSEARAQFTRQMAEGYPSLPGPQQQWLASVPLEWAKTRVVWLHADEMQRAELAQQLIAFYGRTAEATGVLDTDPAPVPAPVPVPVEPPVFGAASARTAHAESGPAAGGVGRPLEEMSESELLQQIIADQESEEASLLETDPDLALQVKLQNQLKNASMMSNMMNLRHQAAMAVINNIR